MVMVFENKLKTFHTKIAILANHSTGYLVFNFDCTHHNIVVVIIALIFQAFLKMKMPI